MTAGLRFVVCLQEADFNQASKNLTSRFAIICIYYLGKDFSAMYTKSVSKAAKLFPCIFQHFSTRVEVSTQRHNLGLDSTRVVM